jgi:hypothetical protein
MSTSAASPAVQTRIETRVLTEGYVPGGFRRRLSIRRASRRRCSTDVGNELDHDVYATVIKLACR